MIVHLRKRLKRFRYRQSGKSAWTKHNLPGARRSASKLAESQPNVFLFAMVCSLDLRNELRDKKDINENTEVRQHKRQHFMGAHGSPSMDGMFSWNQSSGKSGVRFYVIVCSPYASVELLVYNPFHTPPLKCSANGGSPMRSPKALRSVPLNKSALIPSTSVVHSVWPVRCPPNEPAREKVLGHNSTSSDVPVTDCHARSASKRFYGTPIVPSPSNFTEAFGAHGDFAN